MKLPMRALVGMVGNLVLLGSGGNRLRTGRAHRRAGRGHRHGRDQPEDDPDCRRRMDGRRRPELQPHRTTGRASKCRSTRSRSTTTRRRRARNTRGGRATIRRRAEASPRCRGSPGRSRCPAATTPGTWRDDGRAAAGDSIWRRHLRRRPSAARHRRDAARLPEGGDGNQPVDCDHAVLCRTVE